MKNIFFFFCHFFSPSLSMSYFQEKRGKVGEVLEREGVNGISLKELGARALPLVDRTQDKDGYRWRSSSGFLSEGETFEEVIEKDWQFLERHNISHSQLANEIKTLIRETRDNRHDQSNNPMTITYTLPFVLGEKKPSTQTLTITPIWYVSPQLSLFYNPSLSPSPLPPSSSPPFQENYKWQTEFEIENKNLGLKVRVGGNEQVGVVLYIERYGFFEGGGATNLYRVDPPTLLSILSGVVFQETIEVVEEKKGKEREQERQLFEKMEKELASFCSLSEELSERQKAEREWLQQTVEHQRKKILDLEQDINTNLNQLKENM